MTSDPQTAKLLQQIAAGRPAPRPDMPAWFAFSMAKCGSTMLNKAVGLINAASGIPDTNVPGMFFKLGIGPGAWATNDNLPGAFPDGYCHRGFRYLPTSLGKDPILQERKSVLLLRDLRDAATSHYYSKRHEHPVPGNGKGDFAQAFQEGRKALETRSVDDHVLQYARTFMHHWRKYMAHLPDNPALVKVVRYEDIIFAKREFFTDLYRFMDIDADPQVIADAVAAVDVFPETENVRSRTRVVTPGNHVEKLLGETIERLNEENNAYLSAYGYL